MSENSLIARGQVLPTQVVKHSTKIIIKSHQVDLASGQ